MENNKEETKLYGKLAYLPKGDDALEFMEKIKIPRNKLWYVLVEKQDNELHMVKYNHDSSTVNLNQFVAELKGHYLKSFEKQEKLKALIEKISVVGNDKFSIVKDIPKVKIKGKTLVSIITEDLIKLLK